MPSRQLTIKCDPTYPAWNNPVPLTPHTNDREARTITTDINSIYGGQNAVERNISFYRRKNYRNFKSRLAAGVITRSGLLKQYLLFIFHRAGVIYGMPSSFLRDFVQHWSSCRSFVFLMSTPRLGLSRCLLRTLDWILPSLFNGVLRS